MSALAQDKIGGWIKAPFGNKLHLVSEHGVRVIGTHCGRWFPASLAVRRGAISEGRCCKTCLKIGVRPAVAVRVSEETP